MGVSGAGEAEAVAGDAAHSAPSSGPTSSHRSPHPFLSTHARSAARIQSYLARR